MINISSTKGTVSLIDLLIPNEVQVISVGIKVENAQKWLANWSGSPSDHNR